MLAITLSFAAPLPPPPDICVQVTNFESDARFILLVEKARPISLLCAFGACDAPLRSFSSSIMRVCLRPPPPRYPAGRRLHAPGGGPLLQQVPVHHHHGKGAWRNMYVA